MRLTTLIAIVLWGILLILIGIGVIAGYEVLSLTVITMGLTILLRALNISCEPGKCSSKGFHMIWAAIFIEGGAVIELYKFYTSFPLTVGVFIILLAVSAFLIDRKYPIL